MWLVQIGSHRERMKIRCSPVVGMVVRYRKCNTSTFFGESLSTFFGGPCRRSNQPAAKENRKIEQRQQQQVSGLPRRNSTFTFLSFAVKGNPYLFPDPRIDQNKEGSFLCSFGLIGGAATKVPVESSRSFVQQNS